jgi:hypothetical protein
VRLARELPLAQIRKCGIDRGADAGRTLARALLSTARSTHGSARPTRGAGVFTLVGWANSRNAETKSRAFPSALRRFAVGARPRDRSSLLRLARTTSAPCAVSPTDGTCVYLIMPASTPQNACRFFWRRRPIVLPLRCDPSSIGLLAQGGPCERDDHCGWSKKPMARDCLRALVIPVSAKTPGRR